MFWAGVAVVAPGSAAADPLGDVRGAASLEYEARYVHGEAEEEPVGLGLAGARLRGQAGGRYLGYKIGLDLHAGMTWPAAFAYEADFFPMGLGLRLGQWSRFGVVAGVGVSGATGGADDAAQFPVEAALELALGRRIRVLARARVSWNAQAPTRQDGTVSLPFGDEAEGSFSIRLGNRWTDYDFPVGNGYYLGFAYREAGGIRMYGAVLGHSVDMGTR
jgi:hypothetical protein